MKDLDSYNNIVEKQLEKTSCYQPLVFKCAHTGEHALTHMHTQEEGFVTSKTV